MAHSTITIQDGSFSRAEKKSATYPPIQTESSPAYMLGMILLYAVLATVGTMLVFTGIVLLRS